MSSDSETQDLSKPAKCVAIAWCEIKKDERGNVDGCCGDEIVPCDPISWRVGRIEDLTAYHEVSAPSQCQKNISMKMIAENKCANLKNS